MSVDAQHARNPETTGKQRAGLLINRGFSLLWLGQTVSTLGTYIFDTTLVVWIVATVARGQSWTPLAVSGVFVAAALPPLLLAPLAGVIVDRVSRRGVMLAADALRALIALALMPLALGVRLPLLSAGPLGALWSLGVIYAAVIALSLGDQFFRPASLALVGALVGEAEQPQAMGLMQGSASLAMLIGPAVAPPLYLAFGPQWALLINGASFAVSFIALLAIGRVGVARPRGPQGGMGREMREGIAFLLRSRVLRTLTLVSAVAMLGVGGLNAIDIFFTTHNLHTSLAWYGLLNTALGVGLIVGALGAGALGQRIGLGRMMALSVISAGALVMVYARLNSFVPALVVLFLLGAPLAATSVASGPLVLREAPERLVGRVESLMQPAITAATLVGAGLAGYLASGPLAGFSARLMGFRFGPVDTIYFAAGALILLSGLYALRGLRK
ncbi:MAG TPA: MFS transporter [Ktedonobacterales bacterium]